MSWSSNSQWRIPTIESFADAQRLFNRQPFYEHSPFWRDKPHMRSLHAVDDHRLTITEYYDRSGKATRYEVHCWIWQDAQTEANAAAIFYAPNKRGERVVVLNKKWNAAEKMGWVTGKKLDCTDGTTRRFVQSDNPLRLTYVNDKVDMSRSTNGRHFTRYTGPGVMQARKSVREWAWPLCMMAAMAADGGERGATEYYSRYSKLSKVRGILNLRHDGNELGDEQTKGVLAQLTRIAYDSIDTYIPYSKRSHGDPHERRKCINELTDLLLRHIRDCVEPQQGQRRLQPMWPLKMPPQYWLTREEPNKFDDVVQG